MNKLIFGLLLVGMIVMLSFVATNVYRVNKEFFTTGKVPFKLVIKSFGKSLLAILCFVIFAMLVFIFLSRLV